MDPTELIANRTFDEITIGESASLERTVTKQDIDLYATVSGDANPTHLDEAFAKQAKFKGTVAHSMYSAGLISSLLGNRLPGAGTVYLAQELRFAAPVYAADTITVTVTAREKLAAAERLVRFDCTCVNQDGQTVLEGVATVIAPAEKLSAPAITLGTASVQRHDSYRLVLDRADSIPPIACAVAHPCDESSLRGALEAAAAGLMVPILVGPAEKIRHVAWQFGLEIGQLELVDVPHSHAAAAKAVELVRAGRAELLMKGSLHTDELMSEVVAKGTGLRTARRISHVFLMDVPTYPSALFVTDAAINILPDLATKVDIVQNAIDLHRGLGLGEPRVAILAAVETVSPKMPSTLDAAALCKMADRGQIKGGLLDGPLALDNAISPEAARIKGIVSPVAGQAQILVVPDLEAGNMLAKNLSFMANADAAGIVLGARVPIILTSRADNTRTRMASCAVAALYAHARREAAAAAVAAP
jgi:phosphate acetyltransferase